ncbi:hypothetical protein PVAND_013056 [Polypedilum vanderplanki]|uniref:Fatty acid hydroxylase domain-containing protein n=1 Tax=Polypedilum vanderplanki TaxID=319348 RepID=A0A9J6CPA7_POLVA|nr:hypothetical protein PVAND_013056 [Polypedilum vanderplanki]
MFRILKFIHINPLYLFILFIYGSTRLIEYIMDTKGTWTGIWSYSSSLLDRNVLLSYIFALPFFVIILHWILAGIFAIRDVIFKRKASSFIRASRRAPIQSHIIDLNLAKTVFINQLIVLPSSMLASYYFLKITNDVESVIDFKTVPSFSLMLYKFVLCMMVHEISFFYIHYMLHHPLIYPQNNKQRKDFTTIENFHQHPLEYFLLNIIPSALAIFLTHSDAVTTTIFLGAIVIAPIFEHSGFHIPTSANQNEFKHENVNGMMDYLHGTCKNFLQSENLKNHKILLSMKSQ